MGPIVWILISFSDLANLIKNRCLNRSYVSVESMRADLTSTYNRLLMGNVESFLFKLMFISKISELLDCSIKVIRKLYELLSTPKI